MILQTAYPALIALYEMLTFPSVYADAQKYPGPPYYLPGEVMVGLLCGSLFFTACLLWIKTAAGWLLSILLNGAVALFLAYFIISDRSGNSPMPYWADLALVGLGALFAVVPICLISQQSLTLFGISIKNESQPNKVLP
jgi:peptidoglycan/LPS O-acetylase OafA/YrhL